MTTKKQRRANVAEKNVRLKEMERLENLLKLQRSKDREEQRKFDKERAENKKQAAAKIKEMAKPVPENLKAAYDSLQEEEDILKEFNELAEAAKPPAEQLLWDIFQARETGMSEADHNKETA